jgi:ribonuclease HII
LIDGNDNYTFLDIKVKVKFVVKWDTLIDEIKAASIIAKVFRDYVMDCYSLVYPDYGFDLHKWYGTKKHMEALKKYWVVWIHRKSYKPIKNYEVEKF